MEKVSIAKTNNNGLRNSKRVAWTCGDFVCITRFENNTGAPIEGKNVRIVVSKDADWENGDPYDLLFEYIDNKYGRIFKSLRDFEKFATKESA
tara:strand:+ start:2272 stop:2550 length:279 start_codon:yes stop_codon:yes gene_type:complete